MEERKAREDAILDLLMELTWILSTSEGMADCSTSPLSVLLAKMRALKTERD